MKERLQKIVARSGIYSRRQAEGLIREGKVAVNGIPITQLGTKVDAGQAQITVNGKKIKKTTHFQHILFNKPRSCLVTRSDPHGRKTIYDFLPKKYAHLKPVGRLDYDSQGLILLTNDGEMAQRLTHPRYHFKRLYEVKVHPHPGRRQLKRLSQGIMLDGRLTKEAQIEVLRDNEKSTWISMEMTEGRNRQIRRMCEKVGLTVKTLVRKSLGPFDLKGIPLGKWQVLEAELIHRLKKN